MTDASGRDGDEPEILDSYTFPKRGRNTKHPYNDWLDGRIHRLRRGRDFDANPAAIRAGVKRAARNHNPPLEVRVHAADDDTVIVQSYDPDDT